MEKHGADSCRWFLEEGCVLAPGGVLVGEFDDRCIDLFGGDTHWRWVIDGNTFRPAARGWSGGLRFEGPTPPVVVLAAAAYLLDDLDFAIRMKRATQEQAWRLTSARQPCSNDRGMWR